SWVSCMAPSLLRILLRELMPESLMEGENAEPKTGDDQANRPTTSDRLFIARMASSTVSAGRTQGAVSTVASQYHAPSRSPLAAAQAAWRVRESGNAYRGRRSSTKTPSISLRGLAD